MARRAQEYVAAGDIYQVCLAHRFSAPFGGDPWPLYLSLREASPAPHSAFLHLGDETVLSSSPECFLKMSGRRISTRPIKGTRPRKRDPEEDEREAFELKTSPKEIAELVMITDLERNDLGSICEYGSVSATQLLHLERYAQVFHLVSTVEGELRQNISQVGAMAACFPGGSISGAPKKRALEIIRELEPVPRGLFTGAIGYFGYNGESQFNIAIRTVVIREGEASFHVGAGITADSDPEKEWEETLHKAAGILQAAKNRGNCMLNAGV
jgi:aminodeoxychorismate synthase component I